MRIAVMLVCTFVVLYSATLQAQYTPPQQQDSINVVQEDSASLDNGTVLVIQNDDPTFSDALTAPSYMFKPTPRKAVIYSAIFPGLGQIYNRKYWKLPIVYGGFVGFTYAISWNNGYYQDYLVSYMDIVDGNPETNRWHDMLPFGMNPDSVDEEWFTDVLQQRKDYYRYYRDLSIIGTFAWYLLAIVDAYVDAQLFDFDMSPDLSMRVAPAMIREERGSYLGSSFGLQWSINF